MNALTQEQLKHYLSYNPDTGEFTRLVSTSHNAQAGDIAGTVNAKGFPVVSVCAKQYLASRLAWLYMIGEWPKRNVIVIDGDRTNTVWSNLRLAGDQETVTVERVREVFDYDPDTGLLMYKRNRGGLRGRGEVAGRICPRSYRQGGGYRLVGFNGREYGAHRLIWLWWHGVHPSGHIDHINLDRADNRIANLRDCTQSQNMGNRRQQSNNTSGFKGVSYSKASNKWSASLRGKHLGLFGTPDAAHDAYKSAALQLFGEFARFE